MTRHHGLIPSPSRSPRRPAPTRPGYTLVEILTATVLMLIIMIAVTAVFASVTESIGQSRATLEMTQRLRAASALLGQDLKNQTAVASPPRDPRDALGYTEIVEGPIGPVVAPYNVAWNTEAAQFDSTVGDIDDILMFTVKTQGQPYLGLVSGVAVTSNTAEIIWFVRGNTLYRRVLLVKPDVTPSAAAGFYATNDLSVRKTWPITGVDTLVANSLADLTRPECRFAHYPDPRMWTAERPTGYASGVVRFNDERRPHPFFYRPWLGFPINGPSDPTRWVPGLGLPTLSECSHANWLAGEGLPLNSSPTPPHALLRSPLNPDIAAQVAAPVQYDAWLNPNPWTNVNPQTGIMTAYAGPRGGDDVVLTNVVGFDVKVWDPLAPIVFDTSLPAADQIAILPEDPGYIPFIKTSPSVGVAGLGAYVDLNFLAPLGRDGGNRYLPALHTAFNNIRPVFSGPGSIRSRVYGTLPEYAATQDRNEFYPAVYDTWSLHYEYNKSSMIFGAGGTLTTVGDEDGDGNLDRGSNGLDDDGANGVDDVAERETQPPYAAPLQGIQVKIRCIEPGSRQIREVTVIQKFRTQ